MALALANTWDEKLELEQSWIEEGKGHHLQGQERRRFDVRVPEEDGKRSF